MGRVTREKGYVHEGGRAPFHNSEAEAPPLTAAEKRKATGAANLAREEADNNAHQEATLGKVRRSKATALEKKVWETSKAPVSNANGARKRTASSAKEPEGVKIVKPVTTSDPEKPPKKSSSGSKLQAAQVENGDLDPGEKTEQRRGAVNAKRRYAPAIVVDSDEDEALEALPPSPKPRLKPSKPATMSAASKTTRKTRKGADISEDEAAQASQSEDDTKSLRLDGALSADDNTFDGDPENVAEMMRMELSDPPTHSCMTFISPPEDIEMEDVRVSKAPRHRRQSSASSRASEYDVPVNTDFESSEPGDLFIEDEDPSESESSMCQASASRTRRSAKDTDDGISDSDAIAVPKLPPALPRKSAQQVKYDLEKPQVKARPIPVKTTAGKAKVKSEHGDAAIPAPPKKTGTKVKVKSEQREAVVPLTAVDERQWGRTARLTFPASGKGDLRLTDQNEALQSVIKDAIDLALADICFIDGYPATSSRGAFARPYLLKAARARKLTDIKERVKDDVSFSQALADLICARIGLLRNIIKKLAVAKVPIYYQLTADGVTPHDVRERVGAALADEKFIFPITWYSPSKQVPGAAASTATDGAAAAPAAPAPRKNLTMELKFKVNLPFHASPITEIMQEVFFTAKGLGRKHPELFNSRGSAKTSQRILVASHVAGALHNWKTGRCQNSDFTQERLEATYNSLIKLMAAIREDTPELCHSVMHDLYKKTPQSQSAATVASLGSARNVIRLDLADDED
ncbi:hypothetical protein B0H10DRAFT_2241501 [Mycena sp. CBHHK59/15]|nr:hypothetical protein B0H10DRAFT_2241501 [Mycena sp. CBHHK59/15]